ARTIVQELSPRLLDTPVRMLRTRPTPTRRWDGEAYDLFLRARAEVARWTPPAMRRVVDLCRRSLEIDADRAGPWATMSTAWVFLGGTGQMPPAEAYREAERAIERALAIDPDDAQALANRALHLLFTDGSRSEALAALDHALTVAPGLAFAYQAQAYVLIDARRFDDAVEAARAAVELDPLSPVYLETLGTGYLTVGRFDDARRVLDRALAIDPAFRSATQVLAWTHVAQGDLDRALELMDSLPVMAGFPEAAAGSRGYLYGLRGDSDRARQMIALLEERKRREPEVELDLDLALVYLGLGEHDRVFDRLEAAVARHRGALFFMRWARIWDDVRDHPRMKALLGA
ncbi:MAG: tetratricopeptide repeat protein, partial [Longimicrobiales bacterium]